MGPFPTCKGPEGDKLQGTMPDKFFRIHFGTQYSKFQKNRQSRFCPNCEKVLFWPKFAPFGPKMGEGGLFFKILLRSLFYISGFPTSCQISRKSLELFSGNFFVVVEISKSILSILINGRLSQRSVLLGFLLLISDETCTWLAKTTRLR